MTVLGGNAGAVVVISCGGFLFIMLVGPGKERLPLFTAPAANRCRCHSTVEGWPHDPGQQAPYRFGPLVLVVASS
jgi:hypothetical protein